MVTCNIVNSFIIVLLQFTAIDYVLARYFKVFQSIPKITLIYSQKNI